VCVPVSALPQMVSQAKEDIGTVLTSQGLAFSFKISCNFYFTFSGQIVNLHNSCKCDIGHRHSWALADESVIGANGLCKDDSGKID
jgi:hypothetical protein